MNVEEFLADDLDVQKAVVESLAADKAEQDEKLETLEEENKSLKEENNSLKNKTSSLQDENKSLKDRNKTLQDESNALRTEVNRLRDSIGILKAQIDKLGELINKNQDTSLSNKVALLDRNTEIEDRFLGETRDQVIEVIAEAREKAEKEGRLRRAQLLESVLAANEKTGVLQKKREKIEKLFADNGNLINGTVLNSLQEEGIQHKVGEEYLLPAEIIKRIY